MIVIYDKANTLTLTYVEAGGVKKFTFVPGTNEIPAETWEKLKAATKEEHWDHYKRYLKPVTETDEAPNLAKMDAKDLEELIENTMDLDALAEIESEEKRREKPRKSVLSAIAKQAKEIQKFRSDVDNG